MALRRSRRPSMIKETAVFVINDENDGILPVRAIADSRNHLRNESLAPLDVSRRMFIVFILDSENPEIGIHERHLRQRTCPWHSGSLRQKKLQRQEVWVSPSGAEQPEAGSLRQV